MSKYKCIQKFSIAKIDEDGYPDENRTLYIRKGSKWRTSEVEYYDSEVVLEHDSKPYWIGITKEKLNKCFEEILDE